MLNLMGEFVAFGFTSVRSSRQDEMLRFIYALTTSDVAFTCERTVLSCGTDDVPASNANVQVGRSSLDKIYLYFSSYYQRFTY